MSTITVTNIKATGETASRAVSGVAAAWVSFNGNSTIAIIQSLNVSSLNDDGTGQYGVVYTNALNAGDNFVSTNGNGGQDTYNVSGGARQFPMARSNETSKINSQHIDDGGGLTDPTKVYVGVWGDLA
jgi:hypothetical protein